MICRRCGGRTCVPSTNYPTVGGALNRRAVRRIRECLDQTCGFRESTLELPEHRIALDAPKRRSTPRRQPQPKRARR